MSQGGVLIVDDDPAVLQALPATLRLRMSGVAVETAEFGPGDPSAERAAREALPRRRLRGNPGHPSHFNLGLPLKRLARARLRAGPSREFTRDPPRT